ncbi:MAG: hypothetical protein H6Q75_1247 [Firmicutes bacterium]|nr:hypothetical protein [Bacillota bacterium]
MKRFCMAGVVLLVMGMFATGAFAESNSGESCNMENMTQQSSSGGHSGHDMGNMTSEQMSGHDMGNMTSEQMSGHDMGNTTSEQMSGHDMGNMTSKQMSGHDMGSKAVETREPWTILYGFSGIIAVVIVAAGIMKYSRLLKEVK